MDADDQVDPQRARWLRAVERLRVGLPPDGAAARTSVGLDRLVQRLGRFLTASGQGPVAFMIRGDYGNGKTHALALLRDLAHESGFATCWLNADATQSALNHPQRFLSTLLASLETPMGDTGYAALLTRLLEGPAWSAAITGVIARFMTGGSHLERTCRWHAWSLANNDPENMGLQNDNLTERDELVRLLAGETLSGKSGSDPHRSMAYLLISVVAEVVKAAGCSGLIIVIDELESVLFKLPNVRSRHGAYRTLAALIHGVSDDIRVVMAITPDASESLYEDVVGVAGRYWALRSEPVRKLSCSLGNGVIDSWSCRPLSVSQLEELLDRIRSLYCDAYPESHLTPDSRWRRKTEEVCLRQPPVRIAAREAVDFMDRIRHEPPAT